MVNPSSGKKADTSPAGSHPGYFPERSAETAPGANDQANTASAASLHKGMRDMAKSPIS